jgi:multidrug efflux pump subunit AcrA (membrane-fusion protein)
MKKVSRYVVILFAIATLVSCGNGKKGSASEKAKTEKAEDEATEEEESADADQAPDINKISNSVKMTGKLALDPQNRADIAPIAGGVVRRILTREGYRVGRGQIVAYIENTEVVALQRQYITSVSERSAARLELNRQITLNNQGAGVQKTLQQAEAAYAMANASVLGIGRQLRQLGVNPSSVSLGRITTLIPVSSPSIWLRAPF